MMRKKAIRALRKIADNPLVNLSAGLILIATAMSEIMESAESAEEAGIGAHHGVLAFGIIHALTALPELLHGIDELIKADEVEEEGDR